MAPQTTRLVEVLLEGQPESTSQRLRRRPLHDAGVHDDDDDTTSSSSGDSSSPTEAKKVVTRQSPPTTMPSTLRTWLSPSTRSLLPWISILIWPGLVLVPLVLTLSCSPLRYDVLFPKAWYEPNHTDVHHHHPLGLGLGLLTVAIGQVWLVVFFYGFKNGYSYEGGREPTSIQTKGPRLYDYWEGVKTHFAQPEGFLLLGTYLSVTWIMGWMPSSSYYRFDGNIKWHQVFGSLVIQDGMQYVMHRLEHDASPKFYRWSHKPHHRFTNPRLFDAFDGSMVDTIVMILIPLYGTAHLIHCDNVWTYMAFGSLYANWLTMIHSEYTFPWDRLFRKVGLGTPADHHVHHAFFKYNFGHLFVWFDWIGNTYKDPQDYTPKAFHANV